jgi:glucan phosphoethanolaminetransferase (alkaline phosphatase superfamily)
VAMAAISERTIVGAKTLALGLFLVLAPLAWAADIRRSAAILAAIPHSVRPAAMYGVAVALSFAALMIAPFLRNHLVRCALLLLFLSAFAVDRIVLATSRHHVDVTVLKLLWHNRSLAGPVLSEYVSVIAPYFLATAALGCVLAWPPRRGLGLRYAAVPVAALVAVPIQYASWSGALDGYPSPFLVAARASWVLFKPSTHNDLPLEPVTLPRDRNRGSMFDTVVFVMDESVRGDYLTINNSNIDTTPFLASSGDRIVNFGIASSGGNCSVASRWMFRRGVRPWQLPNQPSLSDQADGIETGPRTTIWQFAKTAGFRTVYIDPFRPESGDLHSGLSRRELRFVDERIVLDGPRHHRDLEAARLLVSTLNRNDRTFLYIDKMGAHFPYDANYPDDFNRYAQPDGSRFVYARHTRSDLMGSYKNAVSWNVDGFFREVFAHADLGRALIVYTSDHGETAWADSATLWRHCEAEPVSPTEVWVPLIAVSGDQEFDAALRASARRSFNHATHFDIFPTLLVAMGYDADAVTARYGPTLLEVATSRRRQFVTGDVIGRDARRWFDASASPGRDATTQ